MRHSLPLFLFCAGLALVACTGRDSADWESLRKEANQLYGEQRYEEAVEVYERALAVATDDAFRLRQKIRIVTTTRRRCFSIFIFLVI